MPRTVTEEESAAPGLVSVDGRSFPLKEARIEAAAGGGVACSTLRQVFENPHRESLEVLYTMPLPADGAVIGYIITVGEKKIVGEIEARAQAEKIYKKALEEGRTGGLLQQERADTFSQRIGNVPPGTTVEVEIQVLHPVAFHPAAGEAEAQWEYRFPTVTGIRYHGETGRVPDSGKLDAPRAGGEGTPVRVGFELRIADGGPETTAPRSASHAILSDAGAGDRETKVRLEEAARLDRDLSVCWKGTTSEIGATLLIGPGLPGDEGRYALVTITPPQAPTKAFPRDLVLLLDASGSMSGFPIESAKVLSIRMLESLEPEDRFEISVFANTTTRLLPEATPATRENVQKAIALLKQVQAGGGTEMTKAIREMLRPLRPDSQRQVVVFTDGEIGFEQEIVSEVLAKLPENSRLHMVGIGSAPNRSLTRSASRAGRGCELILTDAGQAETVAARLLAATVAPVLTGVSIEGPAVAGVAPERPADLFAGKPAMVAVSLRPEGGEITIRGALSGSSEPWMQILRVEPASAAPAGPAAGGGETATSLPLGAWFGHEAIEDREMRLSAARGGEGLEIQKSIETLGLRHRIPSRATSLVAVADTPSVDPRQPRIREHLAVEVPYQVSAEGAGLMQPMAAHGGAPYTVFSAKQLAQPDVSQLYPISVDQLGIEESEALAPPREKRRRVPKPPQMPAEPINGRLLRGDGVYLVIEFECPFEGYALPPAGTMLEIRGRDGSGPVHIRVAEDRGTYPGVYPKGVTLTIVLERTGQAWPRIGDRLILTMPDGLRVEFVAATS